MYASSPCTLKIITPGRPFEPFRSCGYFDAVVLGHSNVYDEHVWTVLFAQSRGFETICGFGDNSEAGRLEQALHRTPDDAVIVS